ncbi:hypothetical protein D3C87_1610570 [compost metagenome]
MRPVAVAVESDTPSGPKSSWCRPRNSVSGCLASMRRVFIFTSAGSTYSYASASTARMPRPTASPWKYTGSSRPQFGPLPSQVCQIR